MLMSGGHLTLIIYNIYLFILLPIVLLPYIIVDLPTPRENMRTDGSPPVHLKHTYLARYLITTGEDRNNPSSVDDLSNVLQILGSCSMTLKCFTRRRQGDRPLWRTGFRRRGGLYQRKTRCTPGNNNTSKRE